MRAYNLLISFKVLDLPDDDQIWRIETIILDPMEDRRLPPQSSVSLNWAARAGVNLARTAAY